MQNPPSAAEAAVPTPYSKAKNILTDDLLVSDPALEERVTSMMSRQKILTLDRSGGDCEGLVRVYAFQQDTLFIEKVDCHDYGFRNDIYLVLDGVLAVARKFELQWDPTNDNVFLVNEKVMSINNGEALVLEARQQLSDTAAIRVHPDSVQQSRVPAVDLIRQLRQEIKDLYIASEDFDG